MTVKDSKYHIIVFTELQGKIVTGVFVDTERAEYTDQYKALLERVCVK